MSFPQSQSRYLRRRRRLTFLMILVAGISLIAFGVSLRSERRDVAAYLDLAKEVADDHAALSIGFVDLLGSLGDLERQNLLRRIQDFQEQSTDLQGRLAAAEVPGTVAAVHGWLTVAVSAWNEALMSADGAILVTLDGPDERTGEMALARSFNLLRVGDRAYEGFVAAVGDLDEDLVTFDYPAVAFAPAENEALFDATLMAARLRAFTALGEQHDVAVTASLDPKPVGERNDIPVVPFSESLAVSVVVSNLGNLPEESVTVRLEVVPRDATREPVVLEESIEVLGPDQATTITFSQLPITPGGLYEAVVEVDLAADTAPDNNVWNLVFIWNEPA